MTSYYPTISNVLNGFIAVQNRSNKQVTEINILYHKHAAKLLGLILQIVECPIKANDILEITFSRAHKEIQLLKESRLTEFAWLFQFSYREMTAQLSEEDKIQLRQQLLKLIKRSK